MTFDADDLLGQVGMLHRYAFSVTGDPHLANDIVQDTMVRALERREQYRGDAPLGNWLVRIAHNLIVDGGRRSGREVSVERVEEAWRDDVYTVDAATVVEQAAIREELRDALLHVPFIHRSAVVLHDIEGSRVADIAEIHGISLPAAKQRLRRGRMALVSALAATDRRRKATRGVPMRCWDARQHVSEYLNRDLDPATTARVEAHLAACPTCPPLYAALVGVHAELGRLRDPDTVIEPNLEHRIRVALDARPTQPSG